MQELALERSMDFVSRYRDNQLSSDDDSEDSDKECNVWKRASTVKRTVEENISSSKEENLSSTPNEHLNDMSTNPKRKKKNTIWTEILQDQLISEDLEGCLLKNKPANYGSRGTESYDYTLKYKDPRELNNSECPMEEEHYNKEKNRFHPHTNSKAKKFVKLNSAELSAARKIIKVLNEKKVYLIQRVVKYVGIEKAMALLNMTEDIEETGGMMIKNNSRRRTPGGVYLQLLKGDKEISKEILDKIFEGEMNVIERKKQNNERRKRKKRFLEEQENVKSEEFEPHSIAMDDEEINSGLENNPVLLSNPTVSSANFSDLEEGEIED